jgi:S-adenosylmethionine:tRNA ribosyltransferase-isomerase
MDFRDLSRFDFSLPEALIRRRGVEPRDAARLFIYDTKKEEVTYRHFSDIADALPEGSVHFRNDTRVRPSRFWLTKKTGGKIEVFLLLNETQEERRIPALLDRKASPGDRLFFPNGDAFVVCGQQENRFFLEPDPKNRQPLEALLERYGQTPLPHYLEDASWAESEARVRYQTLFAKEGASVAAPTAGLHFTPRVESRLAERGIASSFIRLDVGLGTFAPLREEHFTRGALHEERFFLSQEASDAFWEAKHAKAPVVAVGTTTTRTLEYIAQNKLRGAGAGTTSLFIRPPYAFKGVDVLITNFHLPKSSLLLLVEAFLEYKGARRGVMSLYEEAIRDRFAFYSFGDSMLIL